GQHGADIAAAEGEIVRAANSGIVRLAEPLPLSGDTVIVDHGMGILTFYMHMSAIDVTPGEIVQRGAVVGRVGSTGLATGPHLHWGVRVNGVYVDPLLWTRRRRGNRGIKGKFSPTSDRYPGLPIPRSRPSAAPLAA